MEEVEEVGPVLSESKSQSLGSEKERSRTITKTTMTISTTATATATTRRTTAAAMARARVRARARQHLDTNNILGLCTMPVQCISTISPLCQPQAYQHSPHHSPSFFWATFQKPLGHYPCEWYSVLHWIWLGVYRSKQSPKCGGNWV